jgi:VanZ family protein
MKKLLITNWHFMRYLRVAIALFLFSEAYTTKQWFFVAFGLFFLIQAVFNLGCGPNGCAIPQKKK